MHAITPIHSENSPRKRRQSAHWQMPAKARSVYNLPFIGNLDGKRRDTWTQTWKPRFSRFWEWRALLWNGLRS